MSRDRKGLDEQIVKAHFRDGEVVSWWDPENPDCSIFKPFYQAERQFIFEQLEFKGKDVLDVGTGRGRFAIGFAQAGARKVVGIDISTKMLDIASKNAKVAGFSDRIQFLHGDVDTLELLDESFDIVCCMEVFIHLPNPKNSLKELERVCVAGGVVVLNSNTYPEPPLWRRMVLRRRRRNTEAHVTDLRVFYSEREFLQFFKGTRLTIKRTRKTHVADGISSTLVFAEKG